MRNLGFHVVGAMLGSKHSLRALASDDADANLKGQGRVLDDPERPAWIERAMPVTSIRVRALRRKLLMSFLSLASAALVGWAMKAAGISVLSDAKLGALSVFVFAWAGLSRLGWTEQSNSGRTVIERADQRLFHALCWVGMVCAAAAGA